MSIKYKIIELIQEIDDSDKLNDIYKYIMAQLNEEEVGDLPSHTKEGLAQGLRDINEGNIYNAAEMEKIINKWLK
ncbi:MAG: putative transcriptional regulator [Sphingobacteriales bacterium]|jgi:predicted transcriptional regulator